MLAIITELGFLSLNLLILIVILHKVRKVHLALFRLEAKPDHDPHTYSQLVAHMALNRILALERPLPPLRGWAASPDMLLKIAEDTLTRRPSRILECSSGASTLVLARCCELNGSGHVYSLEHQEEFAEMTRERLISAGLSSYATVIDAPLVPIDEVADVTSWYSLENLPSGANDFGMLVIDGPPAKDQPMARLPSLPLLHELLAESCVVYLDDAARPGERAIAKLWSKEFPDFAQSLLPLEKGLRVLERTSRLRQPRTP